VQQLRRDYRDACRGVTQNFTLGDAGNDLKLIFQFVDLLIRCRN